MPKQKVKVTLHEGCSYVVFDTDTWTYLADVCKQLGEQYLEGSDERDGWESMAYEIVSQCWENANEGEDIDEW